MHEQHPNTQYFAARRTVARTALAFASVASAIALICALGIALGAITAAPHGGHATTATGLFSHLRQEGANCMSVHTGHGNGSELPHKVPHLSALAAVASVAGIEALVAPTGKLLVADGTAGRCR